MAVNHYFQAGIPGGRASEQLVVEDLIIECLKIYGFDVYYMPRTTVYEDNILNEDALNKFDNAYMLEMYMQNVEGFEGEGELLSKFGVELRQQATFLVARRRWFDVVGTSGEAQLTTRPTEGDLIYFPLTKSYFEVRKVNALNPFFQVGKLYVFQLECELFQYSSEAISTGVDEVDNVVADKTMDIFGYQLLMEDGMKLLLEYDVESTIILEEYDYVTQEPLAQNEKFEREINVLDFTDRNPFGEVYNL